MRSPCRKTCSAALALLLLPACLGLSGCQVGRTFFQMSSDAPLPFFGMDLLPKRKSASPTEGVSRFQDEPVSQADTASDNSDAAEQSASSRSWGMLLNRSPRNETLALPATATMGFDGRSQEGPVEQFR